MKFKATMEPTTQVVALDPFISARIWQGVTDTGHACYALIPAFVTKNEGPDLSATECTAPSKEALAAFLQFLPPEGRDQ